MFKRITKLICSGSLLTAALVGCVDMAGSSDPSESRLGQSAAALKTQADCPSGSHVIIGTEGDDNITGTNADDCILGLGGNDTISGGNGNDSIFGGPGKDTVNGGNGSDSIYGEDGSDAIHGGNGDDSIYGGDGNDVIEGDNGNDVIFAGAGSDVVSGGNGDDSVQGNDGNDVIAGDNGNDTLSGDAGDDTLLAGNGSGVLDGGDGADTCSLAGSSCEQIESPPSCASDSMCSSGQLCAAPVDICVSCPADAEHYVDVDGWVGGPYSGAYALYNNHYLENKIYSEVGQHFVANSSGVLAGVSFNCARSWYSPITRVRVSVHEFDPASGTTGARVGSGDFDVTGISGDIFNPTDQFFEICGRLQAGRSYLASVAILEATGGLALTLELNESSYPSGEAWTRPSASEPVWQSSGFGDDVDFRIWLASD